MPDKTTEFVTRRLRTPEAARYVGLAPATLNKYRCVGGGPVFGRLGRAVVYTVASLDAWCEAQGQRRSTSDPSGVEG